jgi:hypothetical protein
VRHELQHFGQFLLSDLLRKNYMSLSPKDPGDVAGMLGRKLRSKEYDIGGFNLKNYNKDNRAEHSLIDIEFYTDLEDSIQKFQKYAAVIAKECIKEFAKCWAGENNNFVEKHSKLILNNKKLNNKYREDLLVFTQRVGQPNLFFKTLRNKDIGKWKKAVSLFYTKISSLL